MRERFVCMYVYGIVYMFIEVLELEVIGIFSFYVGAEILNIDIL